MRLPHALIALTLLIGTARAEEPLRTAADRAIDIKHIKLELDVSIKEKQVGGAATIDFELLRPQRIVVFNAINHHVPSVINAITKQPLAFVNTGEQLQIDLGAITPRGMKFSVFIKYEIKEPDAGLYFFAPSPAEPNVPLMVWSQGEPTANQHWFPCLDHPNERQTTEIIARVDAGFEALSNGKLVSRKKQGSKTIFHWLQDKDHVAYLVTLVVGKFIVTRDTWRNKPVLYYVPPKRAGDTKRTFGRTKEMLEFFSNRFGIEYPWDKYAQVVVEQFIMGGMENTSASTLNDFAMHDRRALIDSDADWLIAHELGHQWWGDLVTCKDWAHLWLNEGFATYCEILWAEHRRDQDWADYWTYRKSTSAKSEKAKKRPIVDRRYKVPWAMFDARAYPKGAWVLHMLRHELGDEQFFSGIKKYATDFSYKSAETADLRLSLERHTGRSLERFFHEWTERPGHPELDIKSSFDTKDSLVKIAIKQTQKTEAFHFPLRIVIDIPSGKPITLNKRITEKDTTLYIPAPARPLSIRIDPDNALLADLKETKPRDWWTAQLKAPRVVERIRAVQHLANQKTPANRKDIATVLANDSFFGVRVEAAQALGKLGGDSSRDALIDGLKTDDPKVRKACAEALGKFFGDAKAIMALTEKMIAGDASYFVEAATVESYAKVQQTPQMKPLQQALGKDSHTEVIRQAAINGLAYCNNRRGLDILLQWTAPGKPRRCRTTAIRAIATFLKRTTVTDIARTKAIDTIVGYLKGDNPRVRRAAVETLRDLGNEAEPAKRVLESLAEQDPDRRVRDMAKTAIEKISADTPAPVELNRLRKELDELKKSRKTLEDRLLKMESK